MGRKIPAKKHRGVKDPLKQQEQRLQSLKNKINAPPKHPDDQPVPRSLIQLFSHQNQDKRKLKKTNRNKRSLNIQAKKDTKSSTNPISQMKQLPGESGRGFSLRINSAMKALHHQADDYNYPQDLEDEDVKGEHMAVRRERRQRKRRKAGAGADSADGGLGKLSRAQRQALKKKAKIMAQTQEKEQDLRSEAVYERLALGEVAHAPPALTALTASTAARPGRRDLLLNKLLKKNPSEAARTNVADRMRRERAREDAVAAYRALRASRGGRRS